MSTPVEIHSCFMSYTIPVILCDIYWPAFVLSYMGFLMLAACRTFCRCHHCPKFFKLNKKVWWERHSETIEKNSSLSYESVSSAVLWKLLWCFFFFWAVSFVCFASFVSPLSSSSHSSPATIQVCLPFRGVTNVQKTNFQIPAQMIWCPWKSSPSLSPSLIFLSAMMLCLWRLLQSWWMIDGTLTGETRNLILASTAWTNKSKLKESNRRTAFWNSEQLMPESILGKPCLDKHSRHDTLAADWSLYKQEAEIISFVERGQQRPEPGFFFTV